MAAILVTGGTGTLGRQLVPRLLAAGSDVRVLSRRPRRGGDPAAADWAVGDLGTGSGLACAVRGAAVIVHCASDFRRPRRDLPAARNLIAAASAAGGPHLVYVSIVGVDRVPIGYYRVKLEVERLVRNSGLPWTIQRVTQFHDLLCYIFQLLAKLPVMPVPAGVSGQPADAGEVAARLAGLAAGEPAGRAADFGGPRVQPMADLARAWLDATGLRRRMLPVRLPGQAFRAAAAGGLLAPAHADGRIGFEEYLREHVSPAARSAPYGRLSGGRT
jgi:uncharacterized protein YbjT (DUF2867 family)